MPNVNKALLHNLHGLGIQTGMMLLVHSSYKSLGRYAGGPEAIIDTLIEAVGKHGTIIMPALSYDTVNDYSPYFDLRTTPSCVGVITETFRQHPNAARSLHPTHSAVAVGWDAEAVTEGHHLDDTPAGPNSPYRKLKEHKGKILFIGCGLRPNTSMHAVEELVIPPYLFRPGHVAYTCKDKNGGVHTLNIKSHNFKYDDGSEVIQRYDRVSGLLHGDALLYGHLLAAECFLLDAKRLWDAAEAKLKDDPMFFVD